MTSTTTDRPRHLDPHLDVRRLQQPRGAGGAGRARAGAVGRHLFLEHDGQRDAASSWIDVHARGADLAILLAVLATAWAVWKLRPRRDLWVGSLVLAVLLVLESYLGGAIRDAGKDTLTAVHVPLAMLIMGVAVWLPARARSGRR